MANQEETRAPMDEAIIRAIIRTHRPVVRGVVEKARVIVRERPIRMNARRYIYKKRGEPILWESKAHVLVHHLVKSLISKCRGKGRFRQRLQNVNIRRLLRIQSGGQLRSGI